MYDYMHIIPCLALCIRPCLGRGLFQKRMPPREALRSSIYHYEDAAPGSVPSINILIINFNIITFNSMIVCYKADHAICDTSLYRLLCALHTAYFVIVSCL